MKRRLIVFFVAFAMGITLIACGKNTVAPAEEKAEAVESIPAKESVEEAQEEEAVKTDPVSQKVTDDISSIGDVTIEDKELIERITEIYATLTDSQKEQVTNYIDLINAQEKISELEKEASQKEAESNCEKQVPEGEPDKGLSLEQYIGVYKGLCVLEGSETNLLTIDIDIYMKELADEKAAVGTIYTSGDAGDATAELFLEGTNVTVGDNHYDVVLYSESEYNNLYYGMSGTGDETVLDYYCNLNDGSQLLVARMEREK